MSGLYGSFDRAGAPAVPAALAAMRAAMDGWGPDGSGEHSDGPAGLGHMMLHTTPESRHERLPAHLPGRTELVITADARIDNRGELFAALGIPLPDQGAIGDALLILHAYARWGEACVTRLLGDFAFAIWDSGRRSLFCARDPMGCRPFVYSLTPELFVFASDIGGVLAHPAIPRRMNDPLLALYLQGLSQHAEKRLTFFDGVVKLPPGHWLRVTPAAMRLDRYWSPADAPTVHHADDRGYEEHLRHLLHEAVDCRLRSAFPVGSHLSGGIDSSAVTALAARSLHARGEALAAAYSWSPPPDGAPVPKDERERIEQICAIAGIECTYLEWDHRHVSEIQALDPTLRPREILRELLVQRLARQAGIRVLLSGWGGDEGISFNGRGYLAALFRRGRFPTLFREMAGRTVGGHGLHVLKHMMVIAYQDVALPLLPDAILPLLGHRSLLAPLDERYLNPDFAARHRSAVAGLQGPNLRVRPGRRTMQERLLDFGHLSERCEGWATSGAASLLDYRYPLLDRRVVEFGLGIPDDQHHRNGERRSLFRRAMKDVIPATTRSGDYKLEPAGGAVVARSLARATSALVQSTAPSAHAERYVDIAAIERAIQTPSAIATDWILLSRAASCLRIASPPSDIADTKPE